MVEYVAIDCEMVETVNNNNAVARVTIVNEQCQPVLDEYITPQGRVIDYRTRFSGITEDIIEEKGKGYNLTICITHKCIMYLY